MNCRVNFLYCDPMTKQFAQVKAAYRSNRDPNGWNRRNCGTRAHL